MFEQKANPYTVFVYNQENDQQIDMKEFNSFMDAMHYMERLDEDSSVYTKLSKKEILTEEVNQ